MPDRTHVPDADEIRGALTNPWRLVTQLGLGRRVVQQRDGVLVCCPAHTDRTPSCSVRLVGAVIRARCFACGFKADAIGLVAAALGLPTYGVGFRATLAAAASLGATGSSISGPLREAARSPVHRTYPSSGEVAAVWCAAMPLAEDIEARAWCEARGLAVASVDNLGLARVVAADAALPQWARFRGQAWTSTGHRVVVPTYDELGSVRSLRAIRITGSDTPKRLPPAGHRASGLVLADAGGRQLLAGHLLELPQPLCIVIAEGEPDFLTWATRFSDANEDAPVVLGVLAGAWTSEIAARIPSGSRIAVWTHHDPAGERYAAAIAEMLWARTDLWRAG